MIRWWLPLALVLLALTAVAPVATADDAKGPACTDIVPTDAGGTTTTSGNYTNATGTPTLFFRLVTAVPSCRQVTYTVYVLDENGDTTPLTSASQTGTGGVLTFQIPITDDDTTICVYVTSSIGNRVFDRAPNEGCVPFQLDSQTPPGNFFE
jgi:hypothetical protein